jgi:hypothetical protein
VVELLAMDGRQQKRQNKHNAATAMKEYKTFIATSPSRACMDSMTYFIKTYLFGAGVGLVNYSSFWRGSTKPACSARSTRASIWRSTLVPKGRKVSVTETPAQGARDSNPTCRADPIRSPLPSSRTLVGRKETPCNCVKSFKQNR